MANLKTRPDDTIIFEDSYTGIEAAERSGASQIIVVNSNNQSHEKFNHTVIKNFDEVDMSIFFQ